MYVPIKVGVTVSVQLWNGLTKEKTHKNFFVTRILNVFISFFHLLKRMSLQHTFTYESDVKEVGERQGKNLVTEQYFTSV